MTKVLMVLTSHSDLGNTRRKTGFCLPEAARLWRVLTEAGYDVDFVSPKGGEAPMDGVDLSDPIQQAFLDDPDVAAALRATLTPEQVNPGDYDVIFYAGGHGTMWDFPDNTQLAKIAADVYEGGGVVVALCHGPAGLVSIQLSLDADGGLGTGQSPASATGVAERVVELLNQPQKLAQDHCGLRLWMGESNQLLNGQEKAEHRAVEVPALLVSADDALLTRYERVQAVPVSVNAEDRERVALAVRHSGRVDAATVCALADVLAATRRLEDQVGSAAVLPGIRAHRALARGLLAGARRPIRTRVGSLAGELHQYLGWLFAETGQIEQARTELDAALALGVELDDPDLTSLALSFKGHLAWMLNDPQGVITLSRAARRDRRVFIAQHAYNAHQEARGWAMAGEPAEVDRALGHANDLAERALDRQVDTPANLYWYSSGFFTLQRGLTWHTLRDARFAEQAATELTNGLRELPDAERDSEWAAIFTVAAAEAFTTAGQAERAIARARQAVAVCHKTRSTRLARALRRAHTQMHTTWPTHAAVHELADEIYPLSDTRSDPDKRHQ